MNETKKVSCRDCHIEMEIPKEHTTPPGWHYLCVSEKLRCNECADALYKVNHLVESAAVDSQDHTHS